jgi:hypothetical protein
MQEYSELSISAQVPRNTHKIVAKLSIDQEKDIKEVYSEIIPLGLAKYFKKYKIDPLAYNYDSKIIEKNKDVNT